MQEAQVFIISLTNVECKSKVMTACLISLRSFIPIGIHLPSLDPFGPLELDTLSE